MVQNTEKKKICERSAFSHNVSYYDTKELTYMIGHFRKLALELESDHILKR